MSAAIGVFIGAFFGVLVAQLGITPREIADAISYERGRLRGEPEVTEADVERARAELEALYVAIRT